MLAGILIAWYHPVPNHCRIVLSWTIWYTSIRSEEVKNCQPRFPMMFLIRLFLVSERRTLHLLCGNVTNGMDHNAWLTARKWLPYFIKSYGNVFYVMMEVIRPSFYIWVWIQETKKVTSSQANDFAHVVNIRLQSADKVPLFNLADL